MIRDSVLSVRMTTEERKLFQTVADRLQRDESDCMRLIARGVARELGIIPQVDTSKQAKTEETSGRPMK